jgi:hypothetical protein
MPILVIHLLTNSGDYCPYQFNNSQFLPISLFSREFCVTGIEIELTGVLIVTPIAIQVTGIKMYIVVIKI